MGIWSENLRQLFKSWRQGAQSCNVHVQKKFPTKVFFRIFFRKKWKWPKKFRTFGQQFCQVFQNADCTTTGTIYPKETILSFFEVWNILGLWARSFVFSAKNLGRLSKHQTPFQRKTLWENVLMRSPFCRKKLSERSWAEKL